LPPDDIDVWAEPPTSPGGLLHEEGGRADALRDILGRLAATEVKNLVCQ
jgi:hypothetical protein